MLQKFDSETSEKIRSKIGLGYSALYGILPDTSRYFYILTGMAASVMILDVVTINKNGKILYSDSPMENNCMHYVEEDMYCEEYVLIDEELKINYHYKSKYVLSLVESQHDTICDFVSKKGYFSESGKIIYHDRLEKKCS